VLAASFGLAAAGAAAARPTARQTAGRIESFFIRTGPPISDVIHFMMRVSFVILSSAGVSCRATASDLDGCPARERLANPEPAVQDPPIYVDFSVLDRSTDLLGLPT
jgi:hypothetical protein